uniref:Uncharacterized protein n=1 Tax=Oryza brachyantha TaxID=4533 RepID=J3MKP8_ORYBR
MTVGGEMSRGEGDDGGVAMSTAALRRAGEDGVEGGRRRRLKTMQPDQLRPTRGNLVSPSDLLTGDGAEVPGLDDITIPMIDETQITNDIPSKAEQQEVLQSPVVPPRHIKKGVANRTENFSQKEDVVICSVLLNAQVNKFCSCYDSIERRHQSGKTIHDKISDACAKFDLSTKYIPVKKI